MNNDKFHCPKCKLLFDSLNHLPRILSSCSHSLCSYCINEQLHKTENTVICPIDNKHYENIRNINFFKENQNLIEELQESLNIPTNHNYEISNDDLLFDKSGIINSDKFSDTMNSLNLNSSIISSSHCYYKKSKEIKNSLIEKNNQICTIHSLPLNIICIDEKKKICSQCALNNDHVNHQIMTEIEFMNNIDNLIDIFQEVDNNQIKYLNFNNINTKTILDKISNNINNLISKITKTKNDIINSIKEQCDNIENYLNKRKEEIFAKYQSTNFDISTLRESTLNWMQIVTKKLDQLNEIKKPSIECIKLLDDDLNKNVFNLIRNGKQLNGRYNFVQETLKIINKLENFDKSGISIKPNNNIIDTIFIQENKNHGNNNNENVENDQDINMNLNIEEEGKKINKENKNNKISSSLFDIEENKELINSLHLTKYNFELFDITVTKTKKDEKTISEKNSKDNSYNNNNLIKDNVIENNDNKNKQNNNINNKNNDKDSNNDIMLNLNIDEIKQEENNDNKNSNKKNTMDNINIDKINNNESSNENNNYNNISKIIADLSFNDDTLLINSLILNQNDTIYHKKVKNDYPLDLKNPNRKKEKENSLTQSIDKNLNVSKNNQLEEKEKPKAITTKKIDLSEFNKNNNNKCIEEKNNRKINNKNNKNHFSSKNSFQTKMTRSLENINNYNGNNSNELDNNNNNKINENPINVNVINNNKNEIVINFTKKITGKKNKPICSNYMKSEKKSIFGKVKSNIESSPILVSRSPGRMLGQSKLDKFYSFVPLDKINQKQTELNQYKNIHKTLISSRDFTDNKNKVVSDKNQYKQNKNIDDDININTEYSSNINIRRNTLTYLGTAKIHKKSKPKNEFSSKILKKVNSPKLNSKEINIINKNLNYIEQNNNSNNNIIQNQIINSNNNINNNSQLNNNNNSFETKSKKDLQEIINNQLKNTNPNFSRINMSGFGIQYLCSFLHKNPNINYKEIKLLGCNLNDDDLFILTRTLLDHDIELLILNLSSNKITDDSASNILDILKDCKSLKGLSLYNNMISNLLKDKLKEYVKLGRENYDMVQLYI